VSLRTRFFATLAVACILVALAVGLASRRAAARGFQVIVDSSGAEPRVEDSPRPHPFEPNEAAEWAGLVAHREAQGVFDRSLLAALLAALAVVTLGTALLSKWIVRPIESLTRGARRMRAGELEQRIRVPRDDELGELARALNELATDLVRVEGLRRSLVDDVAHELRTPLTWIQGQIEALQDGLVPPGPKSFAELHRGVARLSHIVADLENLALAEAGELQLEIAPVDLEQVLDGLLGSLDADALGCRVEKRLANLPSVQADVARVEQILTNILANASTHSPLGSRIRVAGRVVSDWVEVEVRDEGAGIPAEHLPGIFERFYRVDSSRQRRTGGVGLGLAIARRLVEAQGGRIRAESEVGQGTAVTFSLPIARASLPRSPGALPAGTQRP
jgi:signal transduction histidine kinase